jgi:hypothetical protein
MSKEHFMAAHEELVEEYLELHPEATWSEAYDRTADRAYGRMTDRLADAADHYRQLRKDGML